LIGLDSRINYDTVGNHNYIFEIQTYNFLGNGGSSFIQMNYSPPNSDQIKIYRGLNSNSTHLQIEWTPLNMS
jgi:hypothetical protein